MNKPYFSMSSQEALDAQHGSLHGLSTAEAARRLEAFGPNKLTEGKKKTVLQVFFQQFQDLLVIILMAAAVISALSENVESTIVIFAVLLLNAVLGTVQYEKAETSLDILKAMSPPNAQVLRNAVRAERPSSAVPSPPLKPPTSA